MRVPGAGGLLKTCTHMCPAACSTVQLTTVVRVSHLNVVLCHSCCGTMALPRCWMLYGCDDAIFHCCQAARARSTAIELSNRKQYEEGSRGKQHVLPNSLHRLCLCSLTSELLQVLLLPSYQALCVICFSVLLVRASTFKYLQCTGLHRPYRTFILFPC